METSAPARAAAGKMAVGSVRKMKLGCGVRSDVGGSVQAWAAGCGEGEEAHAWAWRRGDVRPGAEMEDEDEV